MLEKIKNSLKERLNVVFVVQILLAIFTPILAYAGITAENLTTWGALFDLIKMALSNPYVLGLVAVSVWNAVNNPTTSNILPIGSSENMDIEDEDVDLI
ncbi:phage holin [uncultured Anaerofustis sp.]|uniref:phage holin n=1 Tax=uncultured Anaerofustis sp. TaxID=904996 RepID=UPI0025F7347B|nr:phage holin [uncultured Anaerofustis sp.]